MRGKRRNLLTIMGEDVMRLDRLITDISDASRVDAEISRAAPERQDIVAMLGALADIDDATRLPCAPMLVVGELAPGLAVAAVEGRLVQVLGNLIGNARSFSPPNGRILLAAQEVGDGMVEISVSDEGPGIPEGKLEKRLRAFLFRAAARRELRQAFRPRSFDQQADRRGAERPHPGREPAGRAGPRLRRALRHHPA